jgi:sortase B
MRGGFGNLAQQGFSAPFATRERREQAKGESSTKWRMPLCRHAEGVTTWNNCLLCLEGGLNMNRGRNYSKAPMAKLRPAYKRWLIILLLLLLIISVAELTLYFTHSFQNYKMQVALAEQHQVALNADAADEATQTTATPSPIQVAAINVQAPAKTAEPIFFKVTGLTQKAMKPFIQQNKNTIGWITIEDIVDQPIVYRDNTYYLTHDFSGVQNTSGTIFLDMNHPLLKNAQNLLLWGHNMKDGSMFGRLERYIHDNYLHSHNIVRLDTCFESFTYIIFAVNQVSMDSRSVNYLPFWLHPLFPNEASFNSYIDDVYDQSFYTRYLDVNNSDTLLTFATCYNNEYLVLSARRQREDETEADINHALLGLYIK